MIEKPGAYQSPGLTRIVTSYPRPPLTANQRLHFRAKAKLIAEVRSMVAALAAGCAPVGPCEIGIVWRVPDRRVRDNDNIAPTLKPAIDGLRDAGLLADDNFLAVRKTWQQITLSTAYSVEIWIEEYGNAESRFERLDRT